MNYIILSILSTFICCIICGGVFIHAILQFCKRRHLYDLPNQRKVHTNPTPRLGGITFMPGMLLSVVIAIFLLQANCPGEKLQLSTWSVSFFLGLLMVYAVGITDDLVGVAAMWKFIVQIVAACLLPLSGLYINSLYGFCGIYDLPYWLGFSLTVFFVVFITNAMNLIDGIDGLAAALSILILGGFLFCFLSEGLYIFGVLIAGLMGVLVSFLYFNVFGSVEKSNKVFMGDSGSLTLGYVLAYLFVKLLMYQPHLVVFDMEKIVLVYSLLIVPVFDVVRVVFHRLRIGASLFSPDKSHIHHKLMRAGFSQHKTLLIIIGLAFLFTVINLVLVMFSVPFAMMFLLDIVLYTLFHVLLNKYKLKA